MRVLETAVRLVLFGVIAAVGIAAGWFLFLAYPDSTLELAGIVLLILVSPFVLRVAGGVTNSVAPTYNVAEVAVTGPITRESGGGLGATPVAAGADQLVEQIDRAAEDSSAEALLIRLNLSLIHI